MGILASGGPAPLPGFLNALTGPLNHYGYWAILALVMLEDFGIPVPGETVMIAAAIYAGHHQLNVVAVGVIAFVAAVIGDNIGFAIGHFGGRALALRWGRYVFLTEERLDRAEIFFNRHGGKIIVVARFIEGLRQANGIIAGITGMRWLRFLAFNALGAALWVGTWVSLGYLAGNHINAIYGYITRYSLYLLIAAVVVLAGYITRRALRRRRRHATQAREPAQSQPAESGLTQSEPAQSEPAQSEPAESGLTQSEPAQSQPAQSQPAENRAPESHAAENEPAEARRSHQGS
jgi:membrane protein DedA with SNARE-associated domain